MEYCYDKRGTCTRSINVASSLIRGIIILCPECRSAYPQCHSGSIKKLPIPQQIISSASLNIALMTIHESTALCLCNSQFLRTRHLRIKCMIAKHQRIDTIFPGLSIDVLMFIFILFVSLLFWLWNMHIHDILCTPCVWKLHDIYFLHITY